ncbi:MAG: DUF177 domain-containing protein [Clostridiales bacterium]|nr:DUF177 domain-containing protein [Clostridiales bacterium]
MMLDITAAIKAPGTAIPFVHKEALEDTHILGEDVRFPEPATIKGVFRLVDEALVIKGRLSVTAHAHCARCLQPVAYKVSAPLDESFLRVNPRALAEEPEDPWEEKLVFSGSRVDLSSLAHTLALLELPIRFLCSQDCQGQQLPEDPQDQQPEDSLHEAHPFEALRQLYNKFQEE